MNQDGFAGFRVNQFFNRDGELWSLGSNDENTFSELGFGFGVNPSDQGNASQTFMTDVEFIAGGGNRLYVIKDDGSVWAVGRNTNGELGDGTQETTFDFIKIFDGEDKNFVTTTSSTSTTSTTEEPTTSTSTTSTTEEPTTSSTSTTSTTEEPTTSSTTEEPNSSLVALDLIPEGMTLWLDASDLTSTPTLWSDKSGNDRDSSLVADIDPSIVSNVNGLSMMRFTEPGQKYIWTELNNIRTVFWVTKEDADAQIANGSREFRFLLNDHVQRQENGQNTNPDFHNHRDHDFFWRTNVTDPNILNGTTRLNGSIIDGLSTNLPTNLSVISLKTNGNVFASAFGYDRHVKSRQWLGDLAELIICNQELSDSDVQKVEGYLAHKWGLTDDLPGSHPYKNNSPTTEEPTTSTSTTTTEEPTTTESIDSDGDGVLDSDEYFWMNPQITFTKAELDSFPSIENQVGSGDIIRGIANYISEPIETGEYYYVTFQTSLGFQLEDANGNQNYHTGQPYEIYPEDEGIVWEKVNFNNQTTTQEPTTSSTTSSTTSTTTDSPNYGYEADPDFIFPGDFNQAIGAHYIIHLVEYTKGGNTYPVGSVWETTGYGRNPPSLVRAQDPLNPRDEPYTSEPTNQASGVWAWFEISDRGTKWDFARPIIA
ncbi:MAG: hypothetical protein ACPH54_07195 [Candidatus Poseidoniaceae archaeon]